ncbi:MAG: hypothetical protein B6D59_03530 [Campylobacteraceae bacterium 4484_4]|nr:MAG: hypothetical protein B6D59_03530 [Campylobacteraceae bacterium 4484_4]
MKMKFIKTLLLAGMLFDSSIMMAETNTTEIVATGEAATVKLLKRLGGDLKKELKKGVVKAAKFCSSKAQDITIELNRELGEGVMIHRTSLKYRNPANAPIEEEKEILEALQTLKAHDVKLPPYLLQKKSETHYKYYKPIMIEKKVCLKCHGMSAKISKKVKKVISDTYLNDLATGYRMGDLRGLFVVDIKTDRNGTK